MMSNNFGINSPADKKEKAQIKAHQQALAKKSTSLAGKTPVNLPPITNTSPFDYSTYEVPLFKPNNASLKQQSGSFSELPAGLPLPETPTTVETVASVDDFETTAVKSALTNLSMGSPAMPFLPPLLSSYQSREEKEREAAAKALELSGNDGLVSVDQQNLLPMGDVSVGDGIVQGPSLPIPNVTEITASIGELGEHTPFSAW